jgi:hypothetical protein
MAIPNLYCARTRASGGDLDQNFSGYPSKWLALGQLFWKWTRRHFSSTWGNFFCLLSGNVNLQLSFHSHESSLHRVFTFCIMSLPDFCSLFAFVCIFGLCLLVFSFALYFWWMGSHPWLLFTGFYFSLVLQPFEVLVVAWNRWIPALEK